MKKQLSPICTEAIILDFTNGKIVKYAEVAIPEVPEAYRKPTGPTRCYVAHWPNGKASNFFSQYPVYHLPHSLIEKSYRTAHNMHAATLADLYACILGTPPRQKGSQHGE